MFLILVLIINLNPFMAQSIDVPLSKKNNYSILNLIVNNQKTSLSHQIGPSSVMYRSSIPHNNLLSKKLNNIYDKDVAHDKKIHKILKDLEDEYAVFIQKEGDNDQQFIMKEDVQTLLDSENTQTEGTEQSSFNDDDYKANEKICSNVYKETQIDLKERLKENSKQSHIDSSKTYKKEIDVNDEDLATENEIFEAMTVEENITNTSITDKKFIKNKRNLIEYTEWKSKTTLTTLKKLKDYETYLVPSKDFEISVKSAEGSKPLKTIRDSGIPIRDTAHTTKHQSSSTGQTFYMDQLHMPLNVLDPKGKGIFPTVKLPIQDQRVITSLKHSHHRVHTTIVHGSVAQLKDFPYLVSLKRVVKVSKQKQLWANYCGGSIIHRSRVLTAAHCFEMNNFEFLTHPEKLRVVAGSLKNKLYNTGVPSTKGQVQWRQIAKVKTHADYNFPLNDIAIVFLKEPFVLKDPMSINTIAPARYNTDYAGECYTAGFGETWAENASEELMFAEVDVMSRKQCDYVWVLEMNTFLCSRSILSGLGGGDSGGPLICLKFLETSPRVERLLVGITSGRNYDKTTLFTRVSAYSHWINVDCSNRLQYSTFVVWFAMIIIISTWFG